MTAEILRLRPRMQLAAVDTARRESCDITIFPVVKRNPTASSGVLHPRPAQRRSEAVAAGTRTSGPAPRRSTSPEALDVRPVGPTPITVEDVEEAARYGLMNEIGRSLREQCDGPFGYGAELNVAVHMWAWAGYSYVTALARFMAGRYCVEVVRLAEGGIRAVAAFGMAP